MASEENSSGVTQTPIEYAVIKLHTKKNGQQIHVSLLDDTHPDAVITLDEIWVDSCISALINAFGLEKVEDVVEFAKDGMEEEEDEDES